MKIPKTVLIAILLSATGTLCWIIDNAVILKSYKDSAFEKYYVIGEFKLSPLLYFSVIAFIGIQGGIASYLFNWEKAAKQRCIVLIASILVTISNLSTCIYFFNYSFHWYLLWIGISISPVVLGLSISYLTATSNSPNRNKIIQSILLSILTLGLALSPISVYSSRWPMKLAHFVSKPLLNQLADEVEIGIDHSFPRWAGLFRIIQSRKVDGSVLLIINRDLDRYEYGALVRHGAQPTTKKLFPSISSHFLISGDWKFLSGG